MKKVTGNGSYKILGACNQPFAYKALLAEDKIVTMLPCNVIVQEKVAGQVEVSARTGTFHHNSFVSWILNGNVPTLNKKQAIAE